MIEIRIEGNNYYFIAIRNDRPWGNGIDVTVFSNDNGHLGKLSFACHPEFEDYDYYQTIDTNELINIVSQRIADDMKSGKYQKAWDAGFNLLLRLNRPNDILPEKNA